MALRVCSYQHADLMDEFLSKALNNFPYLKRKPHVLTLEHPPYTWRMYNKEVEPDLHTYIVLLHIINIVCGS